MSVQLKDKLWTNWAGNVQSTPNYTHFPSSISDVQDIVNSCRVRGTSLRVTGAAHSFSPVAKPDDDAMSLNNLRGLISYDSEVMEVRLWAGTYLYEATKLLASVNMGFENMGDIQEQTIAGAVSTGTHGTGLTLASLSDQVVAWTWVDGRGEVQQHRRGDDDLSKALSLSLGMLGVLVDVTLRTIPLYSLEVKNYHREFTVAIEEWQTKIQNHRHVEWFYFPGTKIVQVKETDCVALKKQTLLSKANDFVKIGLIETIGFKVISELCRIRPQLSKTMTHFSANNVPTGTKSGMYHEIFPTARLVRFTETEYAIPLASFEECMIEIQLFFKAHPFYVHFPIECRITAGEDAFLSPTQGQESAFLAFHMYKGMDDGPYFKWVHQLMEKYGGRPHFGKMNDLTNDKLRSLYPNLERFMEIRAKFDPSNIFLSTYLKKLFIAV